MAIDDWKLAEDLNVYQIALLSAGYDPSQFEGWDCGDWPRQTKEDTAAFVNIVKHAARTGKIAFEEVLSQYGEFDWYSSLINVESYRQWLKSRHHTDKFFNCTQSDVDALSNPSGEFYAAKLAAAVRAWTEVTSDPQALNGKTPKKALEIWLRKHANEYGLTTKDGNPNNQGIEEVCKVANWKPQGGASKTPTILPKPLPKKPQRGGREAPLVDIGIERAAAEAGSGSHLPDADEICFRVIAVGCHCFRPRPIEYGRNMEVRTRTN